MGLAERIAAATPTGQALLDALQARTDQLNLPGERIVLPTFESARFTLEQAPGDQGETLRAAFHPSEFYCIGFLLFHDDGNTYAEYHIMQIHPLRPQWFIEAVEAWLRDGTIRTDLRLARMPE